MSTSRVEPDDEEFEPVSCSSYYWIYTSDPASFEARRAIAHFARYDVKSHQERLSDEPSNVLEYIRCANQVINAASAELQGLVHEARSRGITWADIGDRLGVRATAAQKRFRSVPESDQDLLRREAFAAEMLAVLNESVDTSERLDWVAEDERDIEPERFLQSAINKLIRASFRFENHVYRPLELKRSQGLPVTMTMESFKEIFVVRDRVAQALWDLARSGAIGVVASGTRFWPGKPYIDLSPGLYLSYAAFQGTMASSFLNDLTVHFDYHDKEDFFEDVSSAFSYLQRMVRALGRPECIALVQVVNWSLSQEEGHDGDPPDAGPEE